MQTNRREFLTGIGGLAALSVHGANSEALLSAKSALTPAPALPAKNDFAIPDDITYLNCA